MPLTDIKRFQTEFSIYNIHVFRIDKAFFYSSLNTLINYNVQHIESLTFLQNHIDILSKENFELLVVVYEKTRVIFSIFTGSFTILSLHSQDLPMSKCHFLCVLTLWCCFSFFVGKNLLMSDNQLHYSSFSCQLFTYAVYKYVDFARRILLFGWLLQYNLHTVLLPKNKTRIYDDFWSLSKYIKQSL